MKLIFCPSCQDVFKLHKTIKHCSCRDSWGKYREDGLMAEIFGQAIPLGFANGSFVEALENRPEKGLGVRFDAFVIPWECDTIIDRLSE